MATLSEARKRTCRDYNHLSRPDKSIVQTTNSNGNESCSSKQNRKDSVSKAVGAGSNPATPAKENLSFW